MKAKFYDKLYETALIINLQPKKSHQKKAENPDQVWEKVKYPNYNAYKKQKMINIAGDNPLVLNRPNKD